MLCGYFCIITSEKMTASQALVQYKGRDISEKLFRSDKTFIGSRSERVQSSQSMSSKIFIEFIALIVRNRIYNLLKDLQEQKRRIEADAIMDAYLKSGKTLDEIMTFLKP